MVCSGLGTKTPWTRLRKRSCFALKSLFWSPQTLLDMLQLRLSALNSASGFTALLPLTSPPSPLPSEMKVSSLNVMWTCCDMYCRVFITAYDSHKCQNSYWIKLYFLMNFNIELSLVFLLVVNLFVMVSNSAQSLTELLSRSTRWESEESNTSSAICLLSLVD